VSYVNPNPSSHIVSMKNYRFTMDGISLKLAL